MGESELILPRLPGTKPLTLQRWEGTVDLGEKSESRILARGIPDSSDCATMRPLHTYSLIGSSYKATRLSLRVIDVNPSQAEGAF